MGIKFGEIDSQQILDNEFRIGVLENVIDLLLSKNPELAKFTLEDLDNINRKVTERLQLKYPGSGIKLNNEVHGRNK